MNSAGTRWWVALSRQSAMLADLAWLTGDDLATAALLPPGRRPEHLAAVVLVRRLLTSAGSGPAAIARDSYGRPFLPDGPAISYAHADGWVAAALGPPAARLGVDVQGCRRVTPAMIRRLCPQDVDRLLGLPDRLRSSQFATVWAVKEACGKATGRGLRMPPTEPHVPPFQRHGNVAAEPIRWWITQPATGSRPAVAVAIGDHDTGRMRWRRTAISPEAEKGWVSHAA